jgi:hypothetical protein
MIYFANELGLEMPVATQKTDTGVTMGLLKILHKQVKNIFSNRRSSVMLKYIKK